MLTISEAAALLNVARTTVYRMIADGRLQVVTRSHLYAHRYRIPRASVDALLNREATLEAEARAELQRRLALAMQD